MTVGPSLPIQCLCIGDSMILQRSAHQGCQVYHAMGVAGFIVVPGEHFYHFIDDVSRLGIYNRREDVAIKIRRDQRQIAIAEYASQFTILQQI